MKKRRRWICLLLCLLVFAASGICTALAGTGTQWLYDRAGLLTQEEAEELSEQLQRLTEQQGIGFVIVTTDDAEGKSAQTYGEDAYNEILGDTYDGGALYLIDMDNREVYLAVAGEAQAYFSDAVTDRILDCCVEQMAVNGAYASASTFVSETETVFESGPSSSFIYNEDTGDYISMESVSGHSIKLWELCVSLLAAGGIAGAVCMSIVSKYQMKNEKKQAAGSRLAYRAACQFQFQEESHPVLLRQFTNRVLIPKNPPNHGGRGGGHSGHGGGTTTHIGSGGRSFSGGGRKF